MSLASPWRLRAIRIARRHPAVFGLAYKEIVVSWYLMVVTSTIPSCIHMYTHVYIHHHTCRHGRLWSNSNPAIMTHPSLLLINCSRMNNVSISIWPHIRLKCWVSPGDNTSIVLQLCHSMWWENFSLRVLKRKLHWFSFSLDLAKVSERKMELVILLFYYKIG